MFLQLREYRRVVVSYRASLRRNALRHGARRIARDVVTAAA